MPDDATTILALVAIAAGYFLPSMIAFGRRHPQRMAILAVNLFFGWTLLGWFIAITWVFTDIRLVIADVHRILGTNARG